MVEEADRVVAGECAGEVDDVADPVPPAEGEQFGAVGGVERHDGDPVGEEGRDVAAVVTGDDHLASEIGQGASGVGADHAEAAGDEDHRSSTR